MQSEGSALGEDTVEAAGHYRGDDEHGMAVEGLGLALLACASSGVDWASCPSLARRVGRDRASGFDDRVWDKLSATAARGV